VKSTTDIQDYPPPIEAPTSRRPTLRADLTDKADLANVERVLHEDEAITMLVNNADIGAVTPLLQTDVRKADDLIEPGSKRMLRSRARRRGCGLSALPAAVAGPRIFIMPANCGRRPRAQDHPGQLGSARRRGSYPRPPRRIAQAVRNPRKRVVPRNG
jgi:hypothetical protein